MIPMAEYIDRELLLKKRELLFKNIKRNTPYVYHMMSIMICSIPSEDVAPVLRAKWIMDDLGNHHCSNCSKRLPFFHCYSEETYEEWDEEIDESLYCPHCGAKMDEKEYAHDS